MHERLEASPVGRYLISVLCAGICVGLFFLNIPASSVLHRDLRPVARPVVNTIGLDQSWDVFSPNPRSLSLSLYATVEYADGTTRTWRPPTGDRVFAQYRTYRWRKWVEWARADDHKDLWRPAAVYVARQMARPDTQPVRVRLIRRWDDIERFGEPRTPAVYQEYEYFVLDVTPQLLRGSEA